MIAVLTGDVINSRKEQVQKWLPVLKEILNFYGKNPDNWEIYRGDSFQLGHPAESAVFAAIHIKAGIKQIKGLDVRIGIGVGEQEYEADNISESNGSAYVRSGKCFENLNKHTLGIYSGNPDFDDSFNLLFSLAMLTADSWSATVAKAIKASLENPESNQTELADLLERSQSSLSEALKRGGFEEIMHLEEHFRRKIKHIL